MMSKPDLCIYHANCTDGFCAAAIVSARFGDTVEFYEGVYQQDPPDVTGKDVLIVDFSYKRPALLKMAEQAKSITIYDHHVTAKDDLVDLPDNVTCVFDMERSGAMITWNELYPGTDAPLMVEYVQDRDLWRFNLPDTKAYNMGLRALPMTLSVWQECLSHTPYQAKRLIADGKVREHEQMLTVDHIAKAAYPMNLGGVEVPHVYCPPKFASEVGHVLAKDEPFAVMMWQIAPDTTVYSLRSAPDGMDVSEIAKGYGGGGHKHAAGFKKQENNHDGHNRLRRGKEDGKSSTDEARQEHEEL